jgi:DNA-binding MarR family transcriptional regulator
MGGVPVPEPIAAFLLISLGRMLREDVDAALRPLDLSLRHLSALEHLSRQPGLSYSELARRAGVTPQSMQATLTQLEQLGAVERHTSAGRGRTARLHVTPAGLELAGHGRAALQAAERQLMDDVPADQQTVFTATLAAVFAAAVRRRGH